jgi:hypothetical protein
MSDTSRHAVSRTFHRQMYVDLIQAYLRDYGTRSGLARALGLTEAYVSYLLAPVRGRDGYWAEALLVTPPVLAEELAMLKTPSRQRAEQMARHLCDDRARREVLLEHVHLARARHHPATAPSAQLDRDATDQVLSRLGHVHEVALNGTDPAATRDAYHQVHETASQAAPRIDPHRYPAGHAQILMYLHDAASVLDRNDLALGYARAATLALVPGYPRHADETTQRLRINARLAEAVSLNNLGLWQQALIAIGHSETMAGSTAEPQLWRRSLLEQRLTAMAHGHRPPIYHAEHVADAALELAADDPTLSAAITRRLADIYLARGTPRSLRKAGRIIESINKMLAAARRLTPLRKVQLLRTTVAYLRAVGQPAQADAIRAEATQIMNAANLAHQQRTATW